MRICSYQNQSHHWLDLCTAAYNSNTLNNTDSRKSNFTLNFIEERFRVTHKYWNKSLKKSLFLNKRLYSSYATTFSSPIMYRKFLLCVLPNQYKNIYTSQTYRGRILLCMLLQRNRFLMVSLNSSLCF